LKYYFGPGQVEAERRIGAFIDPEKHALLQGIIDPGERQTNPHRVTHKK
jgi:hypothetical protein